VAIDFDTVAEQLQPDAKERLILLSGSIKEGHTPEFRLSP